VSGVLHILQYNRHYYLASLAALSGLVVVLRLEIFPTPARTILFAVMGLIVFWSVGSLIASYYVYNYAGVTRWSWLPATLPSTPRHWLNIHSGLDESTETLTQLFREAKGEAVDIYDPVTMTETSIKRARRSQSTRQPATAARLDTLPAPQCSRDTIFLLLAAHEVRDADQRVELFREAARILTENGQLLLAEHLRDWRNFLAFGPGFLHFHSRVEWLRVARKAGLSLEDEGSVTPLVRWFVFRKSRS